jgi:thymidine kinase
MAKLFFRYSAMNAGKSLSLISTAYNYEERGQNVLIFTSSLDDRYGKNKVKSRVGVERDAISVKNDTDISVIFINEQLTKNISCVLVDEVQFFTKQQIFQLTEIVDKYDTPVICYGLRSDASQNPFEGSIYLMAIADEIEELKTICDCGKKATVNARIIDGVVVIPQTQVEIGGNDMYKSMCRKCYKKQLNK